ncbi:MAG: hypothetical protein J6R59_02215 [Paludibacteraceae bacterium]|nr:hypothetical protein [Paludibacteraceae bacterium]
MKYKIKFVNESWGNFNTKIAKITSKIIKTWANYWREKFPRIAHKSDRLVLIDVLWSYNKLKRHLETEITVDGINYYFVLDIKNKLNGISYQNGNNIIINIPFEKNNDKFYKMLKDDEYWKRLQDTINHELTHYFDKENDMMQNYYDSHSQGSYLHWVLYNTQEIEMRAFI